MKNPKFLLSPVSILIGIAAGVAIGVWFKPGVFLLKPIGDIYLSLLQMCVIPVMASAVVISIGKLMRDGKANVYIRKIVGTFSFMLLAVALLCTVVAIAAVPLTETGADVKKEIGKMMLQSGVAGEASLQDNSVIKEIDTRYPEVEEDENLLIKFLIDIIPRNIFSALTNGENLKIIFVFIIFGIMLKFTSDDIYKGIMVLFEGVYQVFQKIIKTLMYMLPFGLCGLIAVQFSTMGFSVLIPLSRLILLIFILVILIFVGCSIVMKLSTGKSINAMLSAMKDTIIISLGTRNSFAAIPSAIDTFQNKLGMDPDRVNLTLPLGITICRYGNVMIFSTCSVFAARLYNHKIDIQTFIIIVFISVLAAMATSGAPGIIARTMIAMVLTPLGIPAQAIIIMLIAIDPIIDPFTTLINVYPNCAAAVVVSSGGNAESDSLREEGCVNA